MIKNDLQYRIAKSNLKKFQASLEQHNKFTDDQKEWVKEAHKATILGEIEELKAAINEYESLKRGEADIPSLNLIDEIPSMLIKRRISLGWTQEDLANRLGVRPQQVQNDEATNYESASLSRLSRTAQILEQAKGKSKEKPRPNQAV